MADQDPTQTQTPPAADAGQQQQTQQPGPIPYERFKQVNDELGQLKSQLAKFEASQKQADEAKLTEQGKFKELLTQREQELAAERQANMRLKVATAKQLPAALVDRLRGDDQVALEKDADALLALLKPTDGPGVPLPGGGARGALDLSKMTPAQIREARAKGLIK